MRISNIVKKYDTFSLNWQRSDSFDTKVYGIIGPNGCGKTTLMKIAAGLVKPDGGHIDYNGLTARDVTMLFRKPYMMHDTVYRNLTYPLKIRKIKPDKEQVDFYLEMAGLQDIKNQYAPSLSGGQQQKLSFVRALIFSPKIIFIDEAFSNMDIESVALFEGHILKMQKDKPITWMIISHQLSNIKRLCDHVYFMHNGSAGAEGSTDEILFNPQNPDLQKYLQYQTL
jgi:ABC-type multidrug transport system ATPase subunit